MEQICMEILAMLKQLATSTDALKILRIVWIIAACGFGWKTLCDGVKALLSVIHFAKGKHTIDLYEDDEDEEDDLY